MNAIKLSTVSLLTSIMMALAMPASATQLLLPGDNAMTTTTYGGFNVYSTELLEKCAAAGDPRCLPSGPYPVQSAVGQISPQLVVFMGANGNDNIPTPFANQSLAQVDNPFRTPDGNQSSTFAMSSLNEPGTGNVINTAPEFTGDRAGTWEVGINSLIGYLGGHDLVFLFDNNQRGSGTEQWLNVWAQVNIIDSLGNVIFCTELNNLGLGGACNNPDAPGGPNYVPVLADFCVDEATGIASNFGGGSNAGCSAVNAYYITNNLSTSVAEFAAYSDYLNNNLAGWGSQGYLMSINTRFTNNNGGAEQLWICSECDVDQKIPEPTSVLLFATALLLAGRSLRRSVVR